MVKIVNLVLLSAEVFYRFVVVLDCLDFLKVVRTVVYSDS